jgi:hypothetical protein
MTIICFFGNPPSGSLGWMYVPARESNGFDGNGAIDKPAVWNRAAGA